MGALGRFERRLSTLVEGAFAKVFKGQLEPVEITVALVERAESSATTDEAGRRLVHNHYRVELGQSDAERMLPHATDLQDEFAKILREHAQEKSWSFAGPARVELLRAQGLSTGVFRLHSEVRQADALRRRAVGDAGQDGRGNAAPRPDVVSPPMTGLVTGAGAEPDASRRGDAPRSFDPPPADPLASVVPPPAERPPAADDGAGGAGAAAGAWGADAGSAAAGAAAGAAAAGGGAGGGDGPSWTTPAPPPPWAEAYEPYVPPPVRREPEPLAPYVDPAPTMASAPRLIVGGEAAAARDGSDVELVRTVTTLGRGPDNDVQLVDGGISRRHAEIRVDAEGVHVVDFGSTNGVTVNGRQVERALLRDGDTVLLGRTTLTLRLARDL